jgi:hypothetical protein
MRATCHTHHPYEKQLHQQGNNMQELSTHEIEEVSGGNMPESSVGGSTTM